LLRLTLFFISVLCLISYTPAAAADGELLQRDWMVGIVEGLGWSFGLPDEPDDEDYVRILSGGRTFRYEAEALCHPDDLVSVKSYRAYGYCSGDGWLSGISRPTTAHLQILVPLPGTFEITMRLRRPGHRIQIADQFYPADAGEMFENVVIGEITLPAGLHDVTLLLPPDGAVDYLELSASQLPEIKPPGGWLPDAPLRRSDLAITAAQMLSLEEWLVPSGEIVTFQAEDAQLARGAVVTSIRHLGEPDGGSWVRAGNQAGRITTSLELEPGVYRLSVRGMGERPLHFEIPYKLNEEVVFKPYLVDVKLGVFHLSESQRLRIELPPRSGVDSIHLERFQASAEDFLRLTGVSDEDGPVDGKTLNRVLKLLAVLVEQR